MRSQCDAERLYENGGLKIGAIAAGFKAVEKWASNTTVHGKVVAGVADLFGSGFGVWAVAIHAKRSRLEEGCKVELEMAARYPNGPDGGGVGPDPTQLRIEAGAGRGCVPYWSPGVWVPDPTGVGGTFTLGHWTSLCFPIVLDLDRDGIECRTQDNPVRADPDGDGRLSDYSWISPDDGLIVYDDNGDGIGQHEEWVLTTFVHGAQTDLEALRAFDSDGNGILNAHDELWSQLKVGRDLNQNGRLDLASSRASPRSASPVST